MPELVKSCGGRGYLLTAIITQVLAMSGHNRRQGAMFKHNLYAEIPPFAAHPRLGDLVRVNLFNTYIQPILFFAQMMIKV
jgi:hypothetical protein